VGTVFLHASGPDGTERSLGFTFPGDRDSIRSRSAVAALHLARRLLSQS
jgi:nicotinamide mononucleotide (NMN) deamidase PncC